MRDPVGRRAGGVFAFLGLLVAYAQSDRARPRVVEHRLRSTRARVARARESAASISAATKPTNSDPRHRALPSARRAERRSCSTIGRKRRHLSAAVRRAEQPARPHTRRDVPASLKSTRSASEHSREEPGPRAGSGGRCAELCGWIRSGSRRAGARRCDDAGLRRRIVGRHAASEHGRRLHPLPAQTIPTPRTRRRPRSGSRSCA